MHVEKNHSFSLFQVCMKIEDLAHLSLKIVSTPVKLEALNYPATRFSTNVVLIKPNTSASHKDIVFSLMTDCIAIFVGFDLQ